MSFRTLSSGCVAGHEAQIVAAQDDANIFVNDTRYILDNLNTLGWVLIILVVHGILVFGEDEQTPASGIDA